MASTGDPTTSPSGATRSRAPRDSATVVVVRDGTAGLEVLLLLRAERGDYNSGAWVYPGGIVDPADRTAGPVFGGLTDAEASRRLGLPDGGLAYYRAAVRECYEEAGILFAARADGQLAPPDDAAAEQVAALREDVRQGRRTIDALCAERGLVPAPQRLHYIAHWVTPLARPKRFDTRFFLAIVPPGQVAVHDQQETQDHVWLTPAEALAPGHARRTLNVTRTILKMLVPFNDTAALAAWAATPREVRRVLPWLALEAGELRPVQPHEPAYAEVAWLDPDGKGNACCELRPDVAVRLAPHVLRVPAREGGNTYLVGQPGRWLVLDPASADDGHLQAILAAGGGGIGTVVCTGHGSLAAAQRLGALADAMVEDASGLEGQRDVALGDAHLLLRRVDGTGLALLPGDRLAFSPDAAALPVDWRDQVDWFAPPTGFLGLARARV